MDIFSEKPNQKKRTNNDSVYLAIKRREIVDLVIKRREIDTVVISQVLFFPPPIFPLREKLSL